MKERTRERKKEEERESEHQSIRASENVYEKESKNKKNLARTKGKASRRVVSYGPHTRLFQGAIASLSRENERRGSERRKETTKTGEREKS